MFRFHLFCKWICDLVTMTKAKKGDIVLMILWSHNKLRNSNQNADESGMVMDRKWNWTAFAKLAMFFCDLEGLGMPGSFHPKCKNFPSSVQKRVFAWKKYTTAGGDKYELWSTLRKLENEITALLFFDYVRLGLRKFSCHLVALLMGFYFCRLMKLFFAYKFPGFRCMWPYF